MYLFFHAFICFYTYFNIYLSIYILLYVFLDSSFYFYIYLFPYLFIIFSYYYYLVILFIYIFIYYFIYYFLCCCFLHVFIYLFIVIYCVISRSGQNLTGWDAGPLERVVPCFGEKRGDLQRCAVCSGSGLGATSWIGLTWTSANFLRHCSLFLIIDCTEFSFSVTMEIWDWKERISKLNWVHFGSSVFLCVRKLWVYLQLWGEDGFKLKAQDVLAVFQSGRRPLLVIA